MVKTFRTFPVNDFEPPAGFRPKLLKEPTRGARGRQFRDLCLPFSVARQLVPSEYWKQEAARRLHQMQQLWYRFVLNQGPVGSCAGDSACTCKHAMDTRQFSDPRTGVLYNGYFNYQKTSGGDVDRGSSLVENLEDVMTRGCCPEEKRGRDRGWRASPTARELEVAKCFRLLEFFRCTSWEEIVSALLQKYVIAFGYPGHAISGCQFVYPNKLVYMNTWGAGWGRNGFGQITKDRIQYSYGVFAYKHVIAYVEAKKGGGWKWNAAGWQPKYNQQDLAAAVERYSRETMGKRSVDPDKYAACVAECRMAG